MKKFNHIDAYKSMLLVRKFEEKCGNIYTQKEIRGFCHLYIGQEAVISGVRQAIKKGDALITSYRCHGHILAAGEDPKYVFAELMQKSSGVSKGKGGSMHLFSPENEFYGGHGIVGAQVPIGAGIAFAKKYQGTDNVCVAFMGDGAFNQGQVYEAFNMASLWNLPVLFIVENNGYSMGTSLKRGCANSENLIDRPKGFGIKSIVVDGMDSENVYNHISESLDYVRTTGPMFIDMKTYRYRGHSMSDPATYRTKEEVNCYKDIDPIETLRKKIIDTRLATESDIESIESDIKKIINEAYSFASADSMPSDDELFSDII